MKSKWEKVGQVVIDSGCVLLSDPCIAADEAEQLVPKFAASGENSVASKYAVLIETGYGDGLYDVFVTERDGRVAEIKIVCISPGFDHPTDEGSIQTN